MASWATLRDFFAVPISTTLPPPANRQRPSRGRFWLAGLLGLGFALYFFQPALTAWVLSRALTRSASKHFLLLTSEKIEADFFAGHASLQKIKAWDSREPANTMRSSSVSIDFSPWRLLFQRQKSPVDKITLEDTAIHWKWSTAKGSNSPTENRELRNEISSNSRVFFPGSLVCTNLSAQLECGKTKASFENADFTFSPNTAGEMHLPQFDVTCAQWSRNFSNLSGVTAIKERGLYVGGVRFAKDLVLERGALNFGVGENQTVTSELQFSAFGGQWRTDADFDLQKSPVETTAAASFWNLSMSEVGEFLGNREFAEGTLHEGRFTFRGSALEPAQSSMSFRFNATDFRWQERRWNSLIFSAMLANRRIEVPQFELIQERNQIKLNGHAELRGKWTRLPEDFQFQILSQIDDLDAAAQIIVPGQKTIAGEAFFAGEVRNQNGRFSGNLKMRGGPLTISGVAVDRLRGDLNLLGSEISATDLDFVRRDDTATGWATINLAQPRRYSGELEVLAKDAAAYSAILPKTVSDHAVAGGIKLWWSGDGTDLAHSGAFNFSLTKFLLSPDASAVSLDITSHGSYSPAGVTLNQLTVQRPDAKLETAVFIRPESVELRDLHVTGSGGSSISGNLTLPLNLSALLNNPGQPLPMDWNTPTAAHLTGSKVRLEEIGELIGRHPPFRGKTTFELTADGSLPALVVSSQISLEDFSWPPDRSISSLRANLSLQENKLSFRAGMNPDDKRDNLSLDFNCTTLLTSETFTSGKWLDPQAEFSGSAKASRFSIPWLYPWIPFTRSFDGDTGGWVLLKGTSDQPLWSGQISLQQASWQPSWLDYSLQKLVGEIAFENNHCATEKMTGAYRGGSFVVSGSSGWDPDEDLDLNVTGKSITLSSRTDPSEAVIDASLRLQGPASSRSLKGSLTFKQAILHRELAIVRPLAPLPVPDHFSLPWISRDWACNFFVDATQPLEVRGINNSWLAEPKFQVKGPARLPHLLGQLTLQPFASPTIPDRAGATVFRFWDTSLENGIPDQSKEFAADLAPAENVDRSESLLDPLNPPDLRPHLDISRLEP